MEWIPVERRLGAHLAVRVRVSPLVYRFGTYHFARANAAPFNLFMFHTCGVVCCLTFTWTRAL